MDDLISRETAIDALKRNRLLFCEKRVDFLMLSEKGKARVDEIDTCISELLNLPAVQPERKKGKWAWNENNGFYYCSECDAVSPREDQHGDYCDCPNFCPCCGAYMRGEA